MDTAISTLCIKLRNRVRNSGNVCKNDTINRRPGYYEFKYLIPIQIYLLKVVCVRYTWLNVIIWSVGRLLWLLLGIFRNFLYLISDLHSSIHSFIRYRETALFKYWNEARISQWHALQQDIGVPPNIYIYVKRHLNLCSYTHVYIYICVVEKYIKNSQKWNYRFSL